MASYGSSIKPIPILTTLLGLGITAAGMRGLRDPLGLGVQFGLPVSDDSAKWVRIFGSRNVVIGLSTVALTFQGMRRAAGTLVLVDVISGLTDALSNRSYGNEAGFRRHLVGTTVIALVGFANLYTSTY